MSNSTILALSTIPGKPGEGVEDPIDTVARPAWSADGVFPAPCGGGMGIRTPDPDLAKVVLYQLSYAPVCDGWVEPAACAASGLATELVGLSGFEPETSRLSGVCSNQLSYKPIRGSVARRRGTARPGHATPDDPVSSQDLSNHT